MKNDIKQKFTDLVCDQTGCRSDEVVPEARFVEDLGMDSLDTVELIIDVEDVFDLEIPDEVAEATDTVGKAIEYLEQHAK